MFHALSKTSIKFFPTSFLKKLLDYGIGAYIGRGAYFRAVLILEFLQYLTVCGLVLGVEFALLALLFYLIIKKNPFEHLKKIANILVFGLGTSSGTATLPFILWEIESLTDADRQVLRFFFPFAIPLNKNGSAGILGIFPFLFRFSTGKKSEWWRIIEYSFTTLAYSFATGSLPSGSLLTVQTILDNLNLPENLIYTVTPAEWFLDRLRTLLNIYGNLVGLLVVGEIVRAKLAKNNLRNLCAESLQQMKFFPPKKFSNSNPDSNLNSTTIETISTPNSNSTTIETFSSSHSSEVIVELGIENQEKIGIENQQKIGIENQEKKVGIENQEKIGIENQKLGVENQEKKVGIEHQITIESSIEV